MPNPENVAAGSAASYIPGLPRPAVVYPETDGKPIAENTLQFEYITTIKGGVETVFRDDPNVFIAGDLLWYPVEGEPTICTAPDTMVAFGRPKGHRSSYKQWEEGGISPQVIFEVLSPANRLRDVIHKFEFYQRYRVEEYYVYDPDRGLLDGWLLQGEGLESIAQMQGWTSPRLQVRLELEGTALRLYGPDGRRFLSYLELAQEQERERLALERVERELTKQQQSAEREKQRAEKEKQRADALAAQLRALGVEPNS